MAFTANASNSSASSAAGPVEVAVVIPREVDKKEDIIMWRNRNRKWKPERERDGDNFAQLVRACM